MGISGGKCNRRVALFSVALACLALYRCSTPSRGLKIVITGSSTVAPLVSEIGHRFENFKPKVRVDVQSGGSSRGLTDTRRGLADIGMISRALTEAESDLLGHLVALDGISMVVHETNSVSELSSEQIVEIYKGNIRNWKTVGGQNAPITVINKAEGRSTLEVFTDYFHLENKAIHPHVVIGENEQAIKTIAGNPDSIGYVSIGVASYQSQAGVPIRLLPLEGIAATEKNLKNGSFPLARQLNLVTKKELSPLVQEFIDFAVSERVFDLVKAQFFLPIAQ